MLYSSELQVYILLVEEMGKNKPRLYLTAPYLDNKKHCFSSAGGRTGWSQPLYVLIPNIFFQDVEVLLQSSHISECKKEVVYTRLVDRVKGLVNHI